MPLATLQDRFRVPGLIDVLPGDGDLPVVRLTTPLGSADVFLHGAHVARFAPAGERPLLFVSRKSHFTSGKPIRGGLPVIFPWFGPNTADPSLPAHGFARNLPWDLTRAERLPDGRATIDLKLVPDHATREIWPREFELGMTVTVGRTLEVAMTVRNTGDRPFRFEQALHTYLAVSDVRRVTIDGLGGREFLDKTDGGARKTQPPGPFQITGETDRLYVNTPDTVVVTDPAGSAAGGPRVIAVSKQGSGSTVVWNPWIAKAAAMPDFGDDEWPGMLCVETANAADNALSLEPGEAHTMSLGLAVT
ncbi:MAG TPA: D-hexose-6-phosphate mutarotase [Humisphaera sp.]